MQVGDARVARHRQGRMGGGQRAHVEHFAIGGQPTVEIVAVPGGHALLAIFGIFFRHIDPAANRIGLADAIGAAALRHGIAERDHPRAGGNAIFRIDAAGEFVRRGTVGEDEAGGHRGSATQHPEDRIWPWNPHRPNYHSTGRMPIWRRERPYTTMRPTSAPRHDDIASGTWRKWGEPPRGEPKVTAEGREITGPEPAIAGQSGPCPVPLSDNLLQQIITR